MKFHKHRTVIFVVSLVVLALASIIQWTQIPHELARFIAESPLTGFVEKHIVHKTLNPAFLLDHWIDVIKTILEIFILLSLFFIIMTRELLATYFKSIHNTAQRLNASGIFGALEHQLSTKLFLFLFCGCIGIIFFISTFGIAILDFTYTDYLMAGGDLSQHYLGWCMFRQSAWHFPLGLMDNIVYPYKESIIYTDSIPLFAVLFKALSPILPHNFQYFGLFGLIIYFLQGAVSSLVIQKICKNSFFSIIGSLFFILSSVMMQRIYGHTSLAAHFIISLCIYASISKHASHNIGRTCRKNIFIWGALFALAASIHLYFVPMVFIFMIARYAESVWKDGHLYANIISAIGSLIILIVVMFSLGAFYSHADYSAAFLGEASMNMNALFNPQGASSFLKDLPLVAEWKYEGYGYLGFGILLACFLLVCLALKNSLEIKQFLQNTENKRNAILIVAVFLVFTIFALSPVVTLNGKELFRYYIPSIINRIWAIFRSTGRYVWVLMYIIMCLILWAIKKQFGTKKGFLLVCALLAFQYFDLKNFFSHKGETFKQRTTWESPLVSKEWTEIAANKKHVFFVQGTTSLYPLIDFAITHNLTTNDTYLARKNLRQIEKFKDEEKIRLLGGEADEQTLYVFETDDEADKYKNTLDILSINDIIIGVKK
jgi:hypothetical protein